MKTVHIRVLQFILLFGSGGTLLNTNLFAKEVDGLFEISVPVENQSSSTRRRATRAALTEIVVRISGQSSAANNNVLIANLAKSSAYIQRYIYREENTVDEQGNRSKQLMLDLFFDDISLRNLLGDAGLPRWGSNRPQLLVWIAIGNQQQRFIMGTDDEDMLQLVLHSNDQQATEELNAIDGEAGIGSQSVSQDEVTQIDLKKIVQQRAAVRGLPILLPLMDLEDSIAIDVGDVWGRFVTPIRRASVRYSSDAVVAVQLMQIGKIWFTRCLLLHKGRTFSWEQESTSLEDALVAGIDSTTDQLASQYAVLEDSLHRNEILISVSNIEQIDDFANLMDYLQDLTSIHGVNVARVSDSTVQLRINLIGEQQTMLQAISLNNRLTRESMPVYNSDGISTDLPSLFFRWNPESKLQ